MDTQERIDRYYDGTISEADARQLEELIRTDADVRLFFVREGRRHEALRSVMRENCKSISERLREGSTRSSANAAAPAGATPSGTANDISKVIPLFPKAMKIMLAAAAAVALGAFLTLHAERVDQGGTGLVGTSVDDRRLEATLPKVAEVAIRIPATGYLLAEVTFQPVAGSAILRKLMPKNTALLGLDRAKIKSEGVNEAELRLALEALPPLFAEAGLRLVCTELPDIFALEIEPADKLAGIATRFDEADGEYRFRFEKTKSPKAEPGK